VSQIAPGWYKDPAEPTTQRYWDGEGWIGDPLPIDATPPPGPPAAQPHGARISAVPSSGAGVGGGMPGSVWPVGPVAGGPPPNGPGTAGSHGPSTAAPHGPSTGAPSGARHAPPGTPAAGVPGATAPPDKAGSRPAPPGWPYGYPYPYPRTAPAPRPHGLVLAKPSARLVARVVDITVVLVLCAVANAWFAIQWWRQVEPFATEYWRRAMARNMGNPNTLPDISPQANTLLLMIFLVMTAVWFAYEVPGSANTGQTFGKRLLGIKVMRIESDERLGFRRAWRRWSRLGLPTMLWYCCGIGFVLQFVDCLFVAIDRPLHQAIHDKAAGTVVVRVGRSAKSPTPAPESDARSGGSHADPR